MKKLVSTLLITPCLLTAQVYRCNNTWSSKPCEGPGTEVDLPAISKSRESPESFATFNVSPPQHDSDTNHPKVCLVTWEGGAKLKFGDISLTRTVFEREVQTMITARVKNLSKSIAGEGIFVKITASAIPEIFTKIAESIPPGQQVTFTENITTRSLDATHTQDIRLELIYAPASYCDKKRISGTSAVVKDRRGKKGTGISSGSKSNLQSINDQLISMEQEIRQKEVVHRRGSNTTTDLNSDKLRLAADLNRICARIPPGSNLRNQSLKEQAQRKCLTLGRAIRGIGR